MNENKKKITVKEKMPSISAHLQPISKINNTLQKIFAQKAILSKNSNEIDLNFEFANSKIIIKKYSTPKVSRNLNHIPDFKKPLPKKLDVSNDKSKYNIKNYNCEFSNKNTSEIAHFGCFFSPKLKYREKNIKRVKKDHFTDEIKTMNNENDILNVNKICDLSERTLFPQLINKSLLTEEKNQSLLIPKTKKFVTVSFNQIILKSLSKDKKIKNIMNKFLNYKYISLNDLNKKLIDS